mgnify:CR=1 FL=1
MALWLFVLAMKILVYKFFVLAHSRSLHLRLGLVVMVKGGELHQFLLSETEVNVGNAL